MRLILILSILMSGCTSIPHFDKWREAPNIAAQGGFNPMQQEKPEAVNQPIEQVQQGSADSAFNQLKRRV